MPKPPITRNNENPWPFWPFTLKTSSSHKEGSHREWNVLTKGFIGDKNGRLKGLKTVFVDWEKKLWNPKSKDFYSWRLSKRTITDSLGYFRRS